jgi:hypothetical protein
MFEIILPGRSAAAVPSAIALLLFCLPVQDSWTYIATKINDNSKTAQGKALINIMTGKPGRQQL